MADDPAPIPRRVVLRLLAATLADQAQHLTDRLHGTGGRREPRPVDRTKEAGRAARRARLLAQADRVRRWIGDPAVYQGPGVDAAVAAYLLWLAQGGTEALPELAAELADLGRPGLLDGQSPDDLVQITALVLGLDPAGGAR